MKSSIVITGILLLSTLFGGNNKNMKIAEYSVEKLDDEKLFTLIDSLNKVNEDCVGYQILIYKNEYESDSKQIYYFPDFKLDHNIQSYNDEDRSNLVMLCDSLEKDYNNKVFERMCFVEGGGIEYFVLLKGNKIISCFISDGFFWDKSSDDKRLKTFHKLYPKIIELCSRATSKSNPE